MSFQVIYIANQAEIHKGVAIGPLVDILVLRMDFMSMRNSSRALYRALRESYVSCLTFNYVTPPKKSLGLRSAF